MLGTGVFQNGRERKIAAREPISKHAQVKKGSTQGRKRQRRLPLMQKQESGSSTERRGKFRRLAPTGYADKIPYAPILISVRSYTLVQGDVEQRQ